MEGAERIGDRRRMHGGISGGAGPATSAADGGHGNIPGGEKRLVLFPDGKRSRKARDHDVGTRLKVRLSVERGRKLLLKP
jgi:hypothetical protein